MRPPYIFYMFGGRFVYPVPTVAENSTLPYSIRMSDEQGTRNKEQGTRRILIFSLAYYPRAVGGAEVAIKEITDRIPVSEIEFHMVCLRFDSTLPKIEQIGNVLVHRIGPSRRNPTPSDLKRWPLHFGKHLYQLLGAWEAYKLHKQYHYDGIWAMMAHSCGIPAALFKTAHPKVAYIQTLQEGDPPEYIEHMMRFVWPLFRRAFTTATRIQAISTYLADWARRMGATCPIEIIPNGVNTAHFSHE
jgi:glycosyltransferase involved in cell wall biosynthesis